MRLNISTAHHGWEPFQWPDEKFRIKLRPTTKNANTAIKI
jgi:hypothetical protein